MKEFKDTEIGRIPKEWEVRGDLNNARCGTTAAGHPAQTERGYRTRSENQRVNGAHEAVAVFERVNSCICVLYGLVSFFFSLMYCANLIGSSPR